MYCNESGVRGMRGGGKDGSVGWLGKEVVASVVFGYPVLSYLHRPTLPLSMSTCSVV